MKIEDMGLGGQVSYCANCGQRFDETPNFCPDCGEVQPTAAEAPLAPQRAWVQLHLKSIVWAAGGLGVALLLIGLTAFLRGQPSGSASPPSLSPGAAAVAEFRSTIKKEDDAGVAAQFSPTLRADFLGNTATAAASVLRKHYPKLASMQVREVSDDETWLLDPSDADTRLEFRAAEGWKVASVSYAETATVEEAVTAPDLVHRTKHLPSGTRIFVAEAVPGRVSKTYRISARDGKEVNRIVQNESVIANAVPAEIFEGTGTKGEGISKLTTGVRFSDREADHHRIIESVRTFPASRDVIGTSWRIEDPEAGDRARAVLLGPGHQTWEGKEYRIAKRYAFFYFNPSFVTPSRPGKYVVVAEENGRPAAWRVVTVTPSGSQTPALSGSSKTQSASRPSDSQIKAAALGLLKKDNSKVKVTGTKVSEVTRDKSGRWWAIVFFSFTGGEGGDTLYMYKDGTDWIYYSVGSGISTTDLPADVRFKSMIY